MKIWLILTGIIFGMVCCNLCIGEDNLKQGPSSWGIGVISGSVEITGPTNTDFISVAKQADGSYGPGGTASVKENINMSQGVNITIYRLYNGTGLAAISSMPIDLSNLQPSSEPLINPLLVALNDSNSGIRDRAARALGDIRSTEAIDPLINRLNDEDIKVQNSSASALLKITGVDLDKDQQKWIEWRGRSTNAIERVQSPQETISSNSLPTYSQILATYPEGALGIYGGRTEGNVTKVTDKGWDLNLTRIEIKDGDAVIQGYGTKITLDVPVTVDGKTFDAGSKLTVDKDLNWIEVSSWD